MGVAKNLRRGHLVGRLAQSSEEAVEHPRVGPYCPHGARAALLLGQEGVDGLLPTTGVYPLHKILCGYVLLLLFDGVTTIHALVRREVKEF